MSELGDLERLRDEYVRWENDGTPSSYRKCKLIAFENFWNTLTTAISLLDPVKAKPATIADNYPAGGLPEPCSYCLSASEKVEDLISQIDTAIGMITVASEVSPTVRDAKELLLKTSVAMGEIFEQ